MIKISTSILSANNREESIKKLNKSNTDYIHIDVMEKNFVPNHQFPINEINKLLPLSTKPVDIHLMTNNPEPFINNLVNKNIKIITIHLEIPINIYNVIKKIKESGFLVGIAIKPQTNINQLDKYLDLIDLVLIMSVEPGFGGQEFIDYTYQKIKELKNKKKDIIIEVDGGVNNTNIAKLKESIDIAVVGSYITNKTDYNKAINDLKN